MDRPLAGLKVVGPQRPAEIVNARSIGGVPLVLGTLLGVGAAVSLASAIAGSIRTRRRELAVLKSLGFTARQLASTVTWHATTIAVLGLGAGVPLGIIAGRLAWARFAARLDVISEPAVPLPRLALVAVVTVLVANLAAARLALGGGVQPAGMAFGRLLAGVIVKWVVVLAVLGLGMAEWRLPPLPMLVGLLAATLAFALANLLKR